MQYQGTPINSIPYHAIIFNTDQYHTGALNCSREARCRCLVSAPGITETRRRWAMPSGKKALLDCFHDTSSGLQSKKDSVTLTVLTVTETRRRWERWKKKCFVFRQNSKNPYYCEFALLTARCSLRWLEKTSSSPGESLRERLPKRHWPNCSGTKWWFLSWECCYLFNCFDCLFAAFNILTQFLSNLGQLLSDLASVL